MVIKCRNYSIYIYSIRAFIRSVLQIFLLSFKIDPFSESIILQELGTFLIRIWFNCFREYFTNSYVFFIFKFVKHFFLVFLYKLTD